MASGPHAGDGQDGYGSIAPDGGFDGGGRRVSVGGTLASLEKPPQSRRSRRTAAAPFSTERSSKVDPASCKPTGSSSSRWTGTETAG